MNADKPNIALIQKYLNGELDAKAMHSLEREAQDDPFLMDALEGYQNLGRDQTTSLSDVKERFAKKLEEPKRRSIMLWRVLPIAASVLVALTVGILWHSHQSPQQQDKLVLHKAAPLNLPLAQNKVMLPPPALTLVSPQQGSKPYSNAVAVSKPRKKPVVSQYANVSANAVTATIDTATQNKVAKQVPTVDILHGKTLNLPHDITQTTYTGSVTDQTGHALAGVKVTVKGTDNTVLTDSNGVFNIVTPTSQPTIKIAYSGYGSKQVTLSNKDSLRVTLNESVSELAEISVPGYVDDKPAGLAHPLLGWKAFKDYIKKNAFMPDGTTGRVKLAFKIAKNGSIIDIRIIRGKSDAMNQKAIALLMNGPEWSSQNDSKELKLKIRFRRLKTT